MSRPQPEPVMDSHTIRPMAQLVDVLRSEALKLSSVRSTLWTLVAAVAFNIALAAGAALFVAERLNADQRATIDAVRLSLAGLHLSQIAFAVLGVLVISSEYTTGMIRATLAAVPQRRAVLAAKAIVYAAVALAVGIASSFAAYLTFQALLPDADSLRSSLADAGIARAVTGGGLYLAALGLLGLGLGAVMRSSSSAIATVLGLLFAPPILVSLMPRGWQTTVGPFLPMNAGSQIFITRPDIMTDTGLGPWGGYAVFCLYAAIPLIAAFVLIQRRDA